MTPPDPLRRRTAGLPFLSSPRAGSATTRRTPATASSTERRNRHGGDPRSGSDGLAVGREEDRLGGLVLPGGRDCRTGGAVAAVVEFMDVRVGSVLWGRWSGSDRVRHPRGWLPHPARGCGPGGGEGRRTRRTGRSVARVMRQRHHRLATLRLLEAWASPSRARPRLPWYGSAAGSGGRSTPAAYDRHRPVAQRTHAERARGSFRRTPSQAPCHHRHIRRTT